MGAGGRSPDVDLVPFASRHPLAVVPDGHADLQWINGALRVAGPDLRRARAKAPAKARLTRQLRDSLSALERERDADAIAPPLHGDSWLRLVRRVDELYSGQVIATRSFAALPSVVQLKAPCWSAATTQRENAVAGPPGRSRTELVAPAGLTDSSARMVLAGFVEQRASAAR